MLQEHETTKETSKLKRETLKRPSTYDRLICASQKTCQRHSGNKNSTKEKLLRIDKHDEAQLLCGSENFTL